MMASPLKRKNSFLIVFELYLEDMVEIIFMWSSVIIFNFRCCFL